MALAKSYCYNWHSNTSADGTTSTVASSRRRQLTAAAASTLTRLTILRIVSTNRVV
jgi:hypothetical protein